MNSKIRILIVEHDPVDLELLEYELKKSEMNYLVKVVKTEPTYTNALKSFAADIILSDYSLPSFDGATSFRLRQEFAPDTPFIFVSGTIGEENSIEYIKNGVTDYVLKDKLFTLPTKVKRALIESKERRLNKEAEQQKEFDRNNLKALLNTTHDLMWSVDTNFNLITSNAPFDTMMKRSIGKTIAKGSSVMDATSSLAQKNRFRQFYERAFRGEIFTQIEYVSQPDEVWSEISFYPILKEAEVIGTACQSSNISEIKKTERQLEKSESFNRGILNSLRSQIAVIDSTGNIVAVNESWKQFAAQNSGDTVLQNTGTGNNYFTVCDSPFKTGGAIFSLVLQGIKEVLDESHAIFYSEYSCAVNNIKQWFSIKVMKFDSKEPMVVMAHEDISERKLAEDKLIYNNAELNKTNSELDRFVYSASHDLRAPLSSILGLLSLIEVESTEANTLEYATMIRNSVNRLDGFIRNILNYSKNNRLESASSFIPLHETISVVIDSLRNMKNAEGISFKIKVDEQQPFYSDIHRFTIILENLISNAIKFQDYTRSERYIEISAITDKDNLNLCITDNGIGIPPMYHPKIFDMFFRIHGEREGSGIGLYIVKETIEKLKGSIEVESEEKKGTTFRIRLMNIEPEDTEQMKHLAPNDSFSL